MVAREEHLVAKEKNLMAASVTRCGDQQEIVIDPHRIHSGDHLLPPCSGDRTIKYDHAPKLASDVKPQK